MGGRPHASQALGALFACVGLGLIAPAVAAAHPALERAERQLEEANFEQAATTLAELTESDEGLSRDDVARLLRLRAVVDSALGRDAEVRRDLVALASVLEGREPGPLPPRLARLYQRARAEAHGPPVVRLRIESEPDGMRVLLDVDRDPGELTRETEVVCEAGGVEVARASTRVLDVPASEAIVCRGSATGPGGWIVDTAEARRMAAGSLDGPETGDEEPLWPWILGGVGAAIVLGIAIGIGVAVSSQRGVGGPMWVGP